MLPPSAPEAPIFLIGFMGSGKTTIGGLLAGRLHRQFIDLDTWISQESGCSITQIFAQEGEAGFRSRETNALKKTAQILRSVISTGGGAACFEENLQLMLKTGPVIALLVSAKEALKRTGKHSGRPLLESADPLVSARKLLRRRKLFYARADLKIETDEHTPEMIVSKILGDLNLQAGRESA
jgi:shikimate kinase